MQITINILIGMTIILLIQLVAAMFNKELPNGGRYMIDALSGLIMTSIAIYLFFGTFALGSFKYFLASQFVFWVPAILIQITESILFSKLSKKEQRAARKREKERSDYEYSCNSNVH